MKNSSHRSPSLLAGRPPTAHRKSLVSRRLPLFAISLQGSPWAAGHRLLSLAARLPSPVVTCLLSLPDASLLQPPSSALAVSPSAAASLHHPPPVAPVRPPPAAAAPLPPPTVAHLLPLPNAGLLQPPSSALATSPSAAASPHHPPFATTVCPRRRHPLTVHSPVT
ncbi:proline-rich receptor-like protein kinase PERK8 [Syzygium oleosum]|uniref:proline-rich receptor-like protein kinase PERK8 n=1 Tax=Syzygium oleosum TaxID=219896 RepID=UPI0024B8F3E0|nr:proline-rich receptor-like protein kinase PERK8 [Syzygium oleosum]